MTAVQGGERAEMSRSRRRIERHWRSIRGDIDFRRVAVPCREVFAVCRGLWHLAREHRLGLRDHAVRG